MDSKQHEHTNEKKYDKSEYEDNLKNNTTLLCIININLTFDLKLLIFTSNIN